jgi:hypothetical protein
MMVQNGLELEESRQDAGFSLFWKPMMLRGMINRETARSPV